MEPIPFFGTVDAAARFWSIIFGIWVLSAVINVALADIRKRSMLVWGIIGLVFGPVSVLVMWMVVRPRKPKEEKPVADDTEQSS
ncbi:hypothetical protein K8S19_13135 [bacterium]|nr:hypothetical protein [bacterium]